MFSIPGSQIWIKISIGTDLQLGQWVLKFKTSTLCYL